MKYHVTTATTHTWENRQKFREKEGGTPDGSGHAEQDSLNQSRA